MTLKDNRKMVPLVRGWHSPQANAEISYDIRTLREWGEAEDRRWWMPEEEKKIFKISLKGY